MDKSAEKPKSRNQAVKPAISSTLVSAAATEGISLARSLNQKQFKQLTKAEFADKRSNGLCFRCDKKFTPGHRCVSPALQVVLVDKENKDDVVANYTAKVSLNSAGFNNNYTMRLRGKLGREEIMVLIDSGASNNTISSNLVERLGIMVMDTAPFGSILGNGEIVYNQGICEGVIISFPEVQVVEDFKHFKMSNTRSFDVILGIQWLKTLGDVTVNWQLLTMTFGTDTCKITLKGDPNLCPYSRVPAKSMVDKYRSDIDFKVGDLVFLKLYHYRQQLHHYRQQTVAQKPNKKLAPNFYGPYQIINRVGKVIYELKVPNAKNIRPLFHVSKLKRATIAATAYPSIPVVLTEDMAVILTPEKLIGVRLNDMRYPETCKVLIQWKNYEATWELMSSFQKQYPEFHLEEKLADWVGSISSAPTEGKSLARLLNQKQFKRLTKAECEDKRSDGLCFRCDKKFTPGHRCASSALQVVLVDKENKDDGVADMAKVSLNSAGFTKNHTMRLRGILGGEEIVVLIDSGAANNLISSNLVERLGIMVMDTAPFGSILGNGEIVYNQGICEGS